MELTKIFEFLKFTYKYQAVIRQIYVTGTDRDENDAEHAYQLALLGWYLVDAMDLDLDTAKVLRYAISHDLVETYAGDTFFHSKDKALQASKKDREAAAAARIRGEFSEFPELHQAIEDYENQTDAEARFVYALDKMIPVLNIYLDEGRSWQRDGVNLDMIRTKDEKIAVSPELVDIWRQVTELLDQEKGRLFPKT